MGLGEIFGKLFGGGGGGEGKAPATETGEAVEHEGYTIVPEPIREGGQYRTAGRIRREIDGETKEVRFIRADNTTDRQGAMDHSVRKGRQIVDEQGARIFERENI